MTENKLKKLVKLQKFIAIRSETKIDYTFMFYAQLRLLRVLYGAEISSRLFSVTKTESPTRTIPSESRIAK